MKSKDKVVFFDLLLEGASVEELMDATKLDRNNVLDICKYLLNGLSNLIKRESVEEEDKEDAEDRETVLKKLIESFGLPQEVCLTLYNKAKEAHPNKGANELFIAACLLHDNKTNITNSPQGVKIMTKDLSSLLD